MDKKLSKKQARYNWVRFMQGECCSFVRKLTWNVAFYLENFAAYAFTICLQKRSKY